MNKEQLEKIEEVWIGKDKKGLAVTGNASYRKVAELIQECKKHMEPEPKLVPQFYY